MALVRTAVVLLIGAAAGAGVMLHAQKEPYWKAQLIHAGLLERRAGMRDDLQENPEEIACPAAATVILIAGQSNAASHGESRGAFTPDVTNFYQGKCYRARDPLLGGSGKGGSVWSRLAWRGPVVLAPVAEGLTRVEEWAPGGRLWPRITQTADQLKAAGLPVNLVIWHQGESDAMDATDPEKYRADLARLVAALPGRVGGRLVLASGSRCQGVIEPRLVAAQKAVAQASGSIPGPDTDTLGEDYRIDGCHLNDKGLTAFAAMWGRLGNVLPITPAGAR